MTTEAAGDAIRTCRECSVGKPITCFYNKRNGSGRYARDRVCNGCRSRVKRQRWKVSGRPEWQKAVDRRHAETYRHRYPEKMRARALVNQAIERGDLIRPKRCSSCRKIKVRRDGVSAVQGHHHRGYNRPLDVQWLCHDCHALEHGALASKTAGEE